MTLDLMRVVPDATLAQIKAAVGWEIDSGATVADVIRVTCGIGYGGHFDETSDAEDAVHSIIATSPAEFEEIQNARQDYTQALSDAMDAEVTWPNILAPAELDIYEPDHPEPGEPLRWTVAGDLRTTDHGDGNHAWCAEVKARYEQAVTDEKIPADVAVEFDTEHSCFFAYAATKEVAEMIGEIVQDVYQTWTPPLEGEDRFTQPEHATGYYPEN